MSGQRKYRRSLQRGIPINLLAPPPNFLKEFWRLYQRLRGNFNLARLFAETRGAARRKFGWVTAPAAPSAQSLPPPLYFARLLLIRLGNESCDQISASPNGPKRAKSCDSRAKSRESRGKNAPPPRKTAGSLFTHV